MPKINTILVKQYQNTLPYIICLSDTRRPPLLQSAPRWPVSGHLGNVTGSVFGTPFRRRIVFQTALGCNKEILTLISSPSQLSGPLYSRDILDASYETLIGKTLLSNIISTIFITQRK